MVLKFPINIKFLFSLILITCCQLLHAQEMTIRGSVLDADDGSALIGVNIISKEKVAVGTVTELDGSFELKVEKNTTLVFSYTGYKTQEVQVTDNQDINLRLGIDSKQLDEVVVVGYGTQKRSAINGAVSVVLAEDINKTANLRLEQALQGRTSGVQITQASGSPGNSFSVRIRGTGTPSNSDPLYIVDGIWVDGIDFLNPNDIASMSVLKDAASVAIYGTSGANGVVIITTKEGKTDSKGTISLDSYYGVQKVANTVDVLNAQEYATLILEANENNPLNIPDPATLGEGTDWQNEIFETAPMQSHQLSFLGGGKKSTYGVMANYFTQKGVVGGKKSAYERYSARFKGSNQVTDWFKVISNINYSHFTRDALPENNEFSSPVAFALNIDPITTVKKEDDTFNFSRFVTGDVKNPVNRIDKTHSTWTNDRIIGLLAHETKIFKGLVFKTSASLDLSWALNFGFGPKYNLDPSSVFVHERVDQNSVSKESTKWTRRLLENILQYDTKINEIHNFSVLLGTSYRDRKEEVTLIGLADLPSNNPEDAFITNQTVTEDNRASRTLDERLTESTLVSYFSRINYNLHEKYFFSASVRRDGSSRFGANNKFANFPAFSAGWLVTKDLDLFPALNYLKVRASWGRNGNEASLKDYGFVSVVDPVRYVFGNEQTISLGEAPTVPANPDLKWEVSTQTDFGIDAGFFDDRLTISADYFIKETSDLLIPATILATAGSGINASDPPFRNVGTMKNKGFEFALGYKTNLNAFKIDVGFNISFIQNEVTSLGDFTSPFSSGFNQGLGGNTTRMEPGKALGYFYGYQTDGIFQNVFEIREYVNDAGEELQPNATAGDFKFKDLNGDGKISDLDQTELGNPYPDAIFGFTASLDYKGFDLNVFLQGTLGNEIVNATTRYDLRVSNLTSNRLDRWTPDNPSLVEPKMSLSDINGNFRFSDYFVENGSYLRLKTVQLGYTLPKELTKKFLVEKFRIYVSAQNLLTITQYSGLDPEVGKQNPFDNSISSNLNYGIDRGLYPQARIFIGGINVQF